jgi:hypothetical protein
LSPAFIEPTLIEPGATIDVIAERIAVYTVLFKPFQFTQTLMARPNDVDRSHLPRVCPMEIVQTIMVIKERSRKE